MTNTKFGDLSSDEQLERLEFIKNHMKSISNSARAQAAMYFERELLLDMYLRPVLRNLTLEQLLRMPDQSASYGVYRYSKEIEVTISMELDNKLPFRERMKPMVELFHALNVRERHRHVRAWNGQVAYTGKVELNDGWKLILTVEIAGEGNGLPDTCKLVKEEVTSTETRVVYKSVCEGVAANA